RAPRADPSPLHAPSPTPPLHAFPTRRSSDLIGKHPDAPALRGPKRWMKHFALVGSTVCARPSMPRATKFVLRHVGIDGLAQTVRSEEHTSELQSPYDLVCRLLLEKKKNKSNT